jgi:hypothetical protein
MGFSIFPVADAAGLQVQEEGPEPALVRKSREPVESPRHTAAT